MLNNTAYLQRLCNQRGWNEHEMIAFALDLQFTLKKQFVTGASIDKIETTLSTISRIIDLVPKNIDALAVLQQNIRKVSNGEFSLKPEIYREGHESESYLLTYVLEAKYLHILCWLIEKFPDNYTPDLLYHVLRPCNFHGDVYVFHTGYIEVFLQKESTLRGEDVVAFTKELDTLISHVLLLTIPYIRAWYVPYSSAGRNYLSMEFTRLMKKTRKIG